MTWIGWLPPTDVIQDWWLVLQSAVILWLMARVRRLERKLSDRHYGENR